MQLFAKIRRTGIVTEPISGEGADAVTIAREIDRRAQCTVRPRACDPPGRRRLVQRLRARDHRPDRSRLRHGTVPDSISSPRPAMPTCCWSPAP